MLTYIPDAPLSELTWYKIGGKAKYLFYPKDKEEIKKCLIFIRGQQIPFFIIGGGSNVLIGDEYFEGAVICLREIDHIEMIDDFTIRVGAGTLSTEFAEFAYENELEGAEYLYKLPGTVGGAAVMNARAYGSQFSDMIRLARCIDIEGSEKVFINSELEYGYKTSILQNNELILFELEIMLERGDKRVIKTKMDYNGNDRTGKNQFQFPSAGCVFKNNHEENIHAGKLIDSLGFKGKSYGGALVSPHHANFIFNKENANAEDILVLIEEIKRTAKEKQGVNLELELKLFGNFGNDVELAIELAPKKKK